MITSLSATKPRTATWLCAIAASVAFASIDACGQEAQQPAATAPLKTVEINTKQAPPAWAFWQRYVLEQTGSAALSDGPWHHVFEQVLVGSS